MSDALEALSDAVQKGNAGAVEALLDADLAGERGHAALAESLRQT